MPKRCKITVYWLNGDMQEFYGGLHADEKLLRIWPADTGLAVSIPLVCIHHYITEG